MTHVARCSWQQYKKSLKETALNFCRVILTQYVDSVQQSEHKLLKSHLRCLNITHNSPKNIHTVYSTGRNLLIIFFIFRSKRGHDLWFRHGQVGPPCRPSARVNTPATWRPAVRSARCSGSKVRRELPPGFDIMLRKAQSHVSRRRALGSYVR